MPGVVKVVLVFEAIMEKKNSSTIVMIIIISIFESFYAVKQCITCKNVPLPRRQQTLDRSRVPQSRSRYFPRQNSDVILLRVPQSNR